MPRLRNEDAEHSTEEVASELGISTARVRQLEAAALRKARLYLAARGYTLDDALDEPARDQIEPFDD
jgi:DNA-directed RNA polymerase sigma subunit (sigma70/sigma32)